MSLLGLLAASMGVRSITVSANWGTTGPAGAPITSIAPTLTVPAGNPGTIKFSISGTSSFEYKKGAGAFTTVTDGGTLSVSNGDSLQFRFNAAGDFGILSVTDNTTGQLVGTWSATTS